MYNEFFSTSTGIHKEFKLIGITTVSGPDALQGKYDSLFVLTRARGNVVS
jgi:hypothetical protein